MRTTSLIAAVSLFGVVACSKKDDKKPAKNTPVKATSDAAAKKTVTPTPTPTPTAEEIAKEPAVKLARASAKEICACKDFKCARDVILKFSAEMQDVQKARGSGPLPPVKRKAFIAAYDKLRACHNKLAPQRRQLASKKKAGNAEAGKMGALARKMCACKDIVCGRKVYEELIAWNKARFTGGKVKGTGGKIRDFKAAQRKLVACYRPLMKTGEGAPTK